jgi:aspartyl-tRNA(Asn)/glutamyl-tRNA(Gln) amidotransferase subunit C
MTKLDQETIKQLTKLSRIKCSQKEQESLLQDLQRILNYVEQLRELDTQNVPPCNHVLAHIVNVMRDDTVGTTLSREAFLADAPAHIGGLIRVPPVLKTES